MRSRRIGPPDAILACVCSRHGHGVRREGRHQRRASAGVVGCAGPLADTSRSETGTSCSKLVKLVGRYLDVQQLRPDADAVEKTLLAEVRAFDAASRAGNYNRQLLRAAERALIEPCVRA
jgi:hypothetical protein